jgi:hypothetical protein
VNGVARDDASDLVDLIEVVLSAVGREVDERPPRGREVVRVRRAVVLHALRGARAEGQRWRDVVDHRCDLIVLQHPIADGRERVEPARPRLGAGHAKHPRARPTRVASILERAACRRRDALQRRIGEAAWVLRRGALRERARERCGAETPQRRPLRSST